jgi:hypothetical protein
VSAIVPSKSRISVFTGIVVFIRDYVKLNLHITRARTTLQDEISRMAKKDQPVFVVMTGYTVEKFHELLPYFKAAHDEYLSEYQMNGKPRKGLRAYTAYANSPLPCMEERLAFILPYLKLNPIREAQADMFGIEQKQCCELIHSLREILHRSLSLAGSMPAEREEELQEAVSEESVKEDKILLHDGREREIPRPQDDEHGN